MPQLRIRSILCLLVTLSLSIPASFAADKEEQGYVLEQNCLSMGPQHISMTQKGIRIDDRKLGNVLISTAPSWKVSIFNTKSRRVVSTPAEKYFGGATPWVVVGLGISFHNLPLQFQKQTTEKGLVLRTFVMPKKPTPKLDDRRKAFNQLQGIIGASYTVTNSVQLPKEIQKILVKYYGLPDKEGYPITVDYDDAEGMHFNWLVTQSLKPGFIKASAFVGPTNYQVVKAEVDLLCPSTTSQVQDILDLTRTRDDK